MSNHNDIQAEWTNVAAEAARTSLCRETIRRWLRSGRLKGVKVGPHYWLIRKGDVDRLLLEGES